MIIDGDDNIKTQFLSMLNTEMLKSGFFYIYHEEKFDYVVKTNSGALSQGPVVFPHKNSMKGPKNKLNKM